MLKSRMDVMHDLPIFAAARASDPPTSHQAASRAPVRGHALLVIKALDVGPAGQTEIAKRAGLTVAAVSKRPHELRKVGAIERTGREVARGEDEYRNTAASR